MYNQGLQTEDSMILTFKELGITAADYNGMHITEAVPALINIAADRITMAQWQQPPTSIEMLYDWNASIVDFVNHTIKVIPSSYDVWAMLNL